MEANAIIRFTERAIFTLVLLGFVTLIFFMTLGLGPVARLVPLRVAIVTLALIVVQLVLDILPRHAERIYVTEQPHPSEARQIRGVVESPIRSNSHQSTGRLPTLKRELGVFLWMLMLPAAIYLFGFLVAVPLYTFFFLKVRSRKAYPLSIMAAAGLFCLLYGIFDILLGIPLEIGLFWRWLG